MQNVQKGFVVTLLIVIIAIVAIVGWVYIYQKKQRLVETPKTVSTYINSNNDFALRFPESWSGYRTVEDQVAGDRCVHFGIKDQDKVFAICILTKEHYIQYLKQDLQDMKYIAENNNKIYMWGHAQDYTDTANVFVHEIPGIIDSFRIVSRSASDSFDITFSVSEATHTLQVLKNNDSIFKMILSDEAIRAHTLAPDAQQFITNLDVNFDGYSDVGVFTSTGYAGVNNVYDFYIYNPQTSGFEKNAILVDISNPVVDASKKQVISNMRSGPQWYKDIFQFNGTTYVKGK